MGDSSLRLAAFCVVPRLQSSRTVALTSVSDAFHFDVTVEATFASFGCSAGTNSALTIIAWVV